MDRRARYRNISKKRDGQEYVRFFLTSMSSTRLSMISDVRSPIPPTTQRTISLVRPNIYERNIHRPKQAEVSSPAFAFLFSAIVQYTQHRVAGINDLERRFATTMSAPEMSLPVDHIGSQA